MLRGPTSILSSATQVRRTAAQMKPARRIMMRSRLPWRHFSARPRHQQPPKQLRNPLTSSTQSSSPLFQVPQTCSLACQVWLWRRALSRAATFRTFSSDARRNRKRHCCCCSGVHPRIRWLGAESWLSFSGASPRLGKVRRSELKLA